MKLALLQLNPTVGALEENAERIVAGVQSAQRDGAELAVTTELAVAGYLPRDLLLRPTFVQSCLDNAMRIAVALSGQHSGSGGRSTEKYQEALAVRCSTRGYS